MTFGNKVEMLHDYKTPGPPGESVVCPKENEEIVSNADQKEFRSGVGMLLYLVKHSRPDISNAVRELAKVMDGANLAHMKMLYRAIRFVLNTKDKSLFFNPKNVIGGMWDVFAYVDSDYAGDKDTRISVTGYVIFVQGCLISWKSKSQRSVTLSSTEAEYVAISDVCAEILFVKQILEYMAIRIKLPITVYVDNVGAIFLSNNATTNQRTKHIDVRYHFTRELIEAGIIKIIFVKTNDNKADIYTKNVSQELFEKHTEQYLLEQDISQQEGC
jgi:hypothetical protein